MKIVGKAFLKATDGGLSIFRKYLSHDFNLDETLVVDDDVRFKVTWNSRYENYAVYIDELYGKSWVSYGRFNAIWFVKDKFDLTEQETYAKLDREMKLGILTSKEPQVTSAPDEEPKPSTPNPLGFDLK